jgi:glycosyltransferase involved in cell wall biosynthesis
MASLQPDAAQRPRALVLLTETFADGGIQRFNRTFLSACDRLGVAFDVLSFGDHESSRTRWTAPSSAKITVFGRSKLRFALAAAAALLRGGYRLVIVGHVNLLELVAANMSLRRAARVILIAHGIEVWTGMQDARRRRAFDTVDLILSVSRYTRERMREQLPELSNERFSIFPNALSETWTGRFGQTEPVELPVSLSARFLLSVTRLDRGDRYKGIVTVIEALAMLNDTEVHYVIAGRGDDQKFLQRVVRRFGLSERVHFVGSVSDAQLARLYRECTAFILPSGKEGFGIVFLEAMFFCAPVIAAREKGAVDVVRDGETGLLVPYGDTMCLAGAIERVLGDADLRARLRDGGRASVLEGGAFTFQAYVERLAGVLAVPVPAVGGS